MTTRREVLAGAAALTVGSALSPAWSSTSSAPLGFQNGPQQGTPWTSMRLMEGRMPSGLAGTLYRNGPGHFRRGGDVAGHWFDGDGLVRAVRFDGEGVRFAARFVDTNKRRLETEAGRLIMPGFGSKAAPGAPVTSADDTNAANTALLSVDDQLWALWEAGSPYGVNPEDLSTVGPLVLRDDLAQMPFSAHPKVSPDGTIWNFGLAFGRSKVFLWMLNADGSVQRSGLIDLPRASYIHDWVMSPTKLILPLQPWVLEEVHPPYVQSLRWRPEIGMQVLVIDKDDFSKRRIYELPSGSFFHTGDAYEEPDGTIRFDWCLAEEPMLNAEDGRSILLGQRSDKANPMMCRAALRPDGSAALDRTSFSAEFAQIDPRYRSRRRSVVYSVSEGASPPQSSYHHNAVQSINWETGARDLFDFGARTLTEEALYVPREPAGEGWLLVPTLSLDDEATDLHVFNAEAISDGPLATYRAPSAMPLGFHGVWVPR
ncbi:MAG: carotenoid oxygenase family protein [Pseudomonadota bacterium]